VKNEVREARMKKTVGSGILRESGTGCVRIRKTKWCLFLYSVTWGRGGRGGSMGQRRKEYT